MKTSLNGINYLKGFEDLVLTAYYDSSDVLTIGYGHTNATGTFSFKAGQTITAAEADRIFKLDVALFEAAVNKHVTYPINQNQFDALVSLTFNIGETKFRKSDLLVYLNNGQISLAAAQFGLYVYSSKGEKLSGLVRRRAEEREMFLADDSRLQ